jgi:hypothetical protein
VNLASHSWCANVRVCMFLGKWREKLDFNLYKQWKIYIKKIWQTSDRKLNEMKIMIILKLFFVCKIFIKK